MRHNQQFSLKNIALFCQSPEVFLYFAKNVEIDAAQSVDYDQVKKFIDKNSLKWVVPVKTLCLRLIDQKSLLCQLHSIFVTNIAKSKCFTQALPIINAQAIPFKMDQRVLDNYNYAAFQVYSNLGMYEKAYKKIEQVITCSSKRQQKQFMKFTIPYLLLARVLRKLHIRKQHIYTTLQSTLATRELASSKQNDSFYMRKIQIQNLFYYAQGQKYQQEVLKSTIGNNKLFLNLFQLSKTRKYGLQDQVEQYISMKYQRIKTSEILQVPLADPATMRDINKHRVLAKYDCAQKIIYFNHEKSNIDQVNELITKCYDLTQALKHIKNLGPMMAKGMMSEFKGLASLLGRGAGGRMGMGMGMRDMDEEDD